MTSLMICKALLESCPVDEQSALLALLPAEERKQLEMLPSATLTQKKKGDPLNRIHFSWIAPFLRTLAKHDVRLFLAALSKSQVSGLKKLLGFSETLPTLSSSGKEFIQDFLFKQLAGAQELIPFEYIPASALRSLLELNHGQLMRLMQLLGLYDLSFEMRQIIVTAQIKKILSVLEEDEKQLLKEISQDHDPLVFKRLFLQGWDGKRSSLIQLLEERGLQRLSFALYGQETSLIWFVAHALELSVATQLLKLCKEPHEKRISRKLTEQILHILSKAML